MLSGRQSLVDVHPELVEQTLVSFNVSGVMSFLGENPSETFEL